MSAWLHRTTFRKCTGRSTKLTDMGIPKENLAQGERIILQRHPHWKCLVAPMLVFVIATGTAGVLAGDRKSVV